jgi:hypothetical protein
VIVHGAHSAAAPVMSNEMHAREYVLRRRQALLSMNVRPLMIEQPLVFINL